MNVALDRSDVPHELPRLQAGVAFPLERVVVIDIARSSALFGMVVFHFARDLEVFGFLQQATTLEDAWPHFARLVAGSFLFLAGVSIVLAPGDGIRLTSYLMRLPHLVAAAAIVCLATLHGMPDAFVFLGVLHSIALASLIGLLFLRPPAMLTLGVAAFIFLLPMVFRSAVFDAPWLLWTGLAERAPRSLDFEPVFPWLASFLMGMSIARLATDAGCWARLGRFTPGRLVRWAAWPGQRSLSICLLHQPVLLGMLWCVWKLAT
jgi:uncharacterized membrane protein